MSPNWRPGPVRKHISHLIEATTYLTERIQNTHAECGLSAEEATREVYCVQK